tara:strand:- start:1612 stop:2274 length:663 start_codon:yes stop_codon:yes gene_type:complete
MSDPYTCEINLLSALDWQRSGADIAKQFIENEQAWLDINHCGFWNDWQVDVFSLSTANDFGLAVWSIILDEDIFGYQGSSPEDYPNWGFGVDDENFFDGSFASESAITYEFTTEQKRILLQLKAFKVLAIGGPIIQTNKAMANIFGNGVILAFDNFDMSFVYQLLDSTFADFIVEVNKRDLLPRPIGIEVSEIRIITVDTFGFAEFDENFNNGNFFAGAL